jgi:alanyl-tRNA synthetase
LLEKKLDDKIKNLISQIKKLDGKISFSEGNKNIFIKKLENYLESLKNKSILSNNDNNKIDEININGINFVSQVIDNLPPKELRSIFDKFKSEKSKSILACITINDDKVSIVVGLTHDLIDLYDARTLIKSTFDILGSKGGGGRVDFAQAGGNKKDQVNQAFLSIKNQI